MSLAKYGTIGLFVFLLLVGLSGVVTVKHISEVIMWVAIITAVLIAAGK